jgi:hypothetical protein
MAEAEKPAKEHSSKEVIEWKRNVNIEQRELKYLEEQEEKQHERIQRWELERLERENLTAAARERKNRAFHKEVALRKATEAEQDYREKMREIKLNQKEAGWQKKEGAKAKEVIDRTKFEERETERLLTEVRDAKNARLMVEASDRAADIKRQQEMDDKRAANIANKENARVKKDLQRMRRVLEDFNIEIDHEIPNQEVPMKHTLVHAVKAPNVMELNFALKDLRENLEDLRSCDMERRAKSQGCRVFQLVRRMEDDLQSEWARVHKSVGVR